MRIINTNNNVIINVLLTLNALDQGFFLFFLFIIY